jgi:cytochrome c-type biogenesis protein CcmH
VKCTKALLVVVSAIGLAAAAFIWTRRNEANVRPADSWVVEAAIAMSRAEIDAGHAAAPLHHVQALRVQRRFSEMADAYREAIRANPMDADAWADLADSLAAAAGHDLTAGRDAIMRALAIEPRHPKALWLRASLELQEERYAAAAATWRELQPLVSSGSTDARVIAANIAEADALAAARVDRAGKGG